MLRIIKPSIFLLLLICANIGAAQTIDMIKNQRRMYIWGEGSGATLKSADNEALSSLISQISTSVESNFEQNISELEINGKSSIEEKVNYIVSTYSNATLHNTERIVLSNEPDAKVFRYIKREDVRKVFESRAQKIKDYVRQSIKAEKNFCIADALRNNYWALCLLKSHPDRNNMTMTFEDGLIPRLITYLPDKMNQLFAGLNFNIKEIHDEEDMRTLTVSIDYRGNKVGNLDYSYWDGQDWGNILSAKNGEGIIDFYGPDASTKNNARIKVEYIYENQAKFDDELDKFIGQIEPFPFPGSYVDLSINEEDLDKGTQKSTLSENESSLNSSMDYNRITELTKDEKLNEIMEGILQAIDDKEYNKAQELFSPEAFDMYTKLVQYGKASILNREEMKFYKSGDIIMCRPVRMAFRFENNNRKFVEDVVFYVDKDYKIESLAFSLSSTAVESLLTNNDWNAHSRLVLISFLEHYKTAYALKRLDYIESIFAEDALIITGHVLHTRQSLDNKYNKYKNNKIVRYNRQTKQQYIRNLRDCFRRNEYINIQFEDSKVRIGGMGGQIYGVQIKQNYFSSRYGDSGYLFLIVDLNNPDEPIIHVRTWQPDITNDSNVYRLGDF